MFQGILMKLGNLSMPKKYCIAFILIHWILLFPISLAIGGHPPLPLMLLYLPTMLVINLIALAKIHMPAFEHIFLLILIPVNTITYGIIGYTIGLIVQRKNNKKSKFNRAS